MIRFYLVLGFLVALSAAFIWARYDAVRADRIKGQVDGLTTRLDVKEQTDDRRNTFGALGECELVRDGIMRLSADASAAAAAFQRCRENAAAGQAPDSGISGPQ